MIQVNAAIYIRISWQMLQQTRNADAVSIQTHPCKQQPFHLLPVTADVCGVMCSMMYCMYRVYYNY